MGDQRELDDGVLKEIHEYGVSLDHDVIYLEGGDDEEGDGVSGQMARRFIKNLRLLVASEAEAITVVINSPGGFETHGMAIYDAISLCPVPITGIVYGEASSMASVILQACTRRLAAPHALIMYHAGTRELGEMPTHESPAAFKWEAGLGGRVDDIMWKRALEKQPDLDFRDFEVRTMRGIYLTAKQAVDYGFLDGILRRDS